MAISLIEAKIIRARRPEAKTPPWTSKTPYPSSNSVGLDQNGSKSVHNRNQSNWKSGFWYLVVFFPRRLGWGRNLVLPNHRVGSDPIRLPFSLPPGLGKPPSFNCPVLALIPWARRQHGLIGVLQWALPTQRQQPPRGQNREIAERMISQRVTKTRWKKS